MNEDELFVAWAAGFLDGEGTIHAGVRAPGNSHAAHVRLQVIVVQTVHAPLLALQQRFGGTVKDRPAPSNPRHRHQWRWVLHGRAAVPFLEAVLPHLRVKGEVAWLGLQLGRLLVQHGVRVSDPHREEREQLAQGIHDLNARSRSQVA